MVVNPKTISWQPPTRWENGDSFAPGQLAGYGFGLRPAGSSLDFALLVDVPLSFEVTSLDMASLPIPAGAHEIAMRTIAYNGLTSVWSNGIEITIDRRVPVPPVVAAA